jgi:hypothetical protein
VSVAERFRHQDPVTLSLPMRINVREGATWVLLYYPKRRSGQELINVPEGRVASFFTAPKREREREGNLALGNL